MPENLNHKTEDGVVVWEILTKEIHPKPTWSVTLPIQVSHPIEKFSRSIYLDTNYSTPFILPCIFKI